MSNVPADRLMASDRATAIAGSKIREMFDLANAHDADLVRLEIGEPDFSTPEHVIDAAHAAARAGATRYTSVLGIRPLREAIAAAMAAKDGCRPDPASEIAVCNGAMEAIFLGLVSVADAGEELVVPTPAWPNYAAQARVAECAYVPVSLSPEDDFDLDATRLIEAISRDTAAVLLNRPCNPTGRVYDPAPVRAVVEAAADVGAYVIADEIYDGLIYEGERAGVATIADDPANVLTVNGCSKRHAMTGWRIGWLAGPATVVAEAGKLHQATTSCASSVSQHAALEALGGDQAPFDRMYEAFATRRDYVIDRVDALGEVTCPRPEGTFYAFLDVGALGEDSFALAKRLLYDYGVVAAPGVGFGPGGETYLRISFANSLDELERGFDRIEAMVADAA